MQGKNLLWSQVWSWFSLVLLLLFLGFWLRQTYLDEREQLRIELAGLLDRLEDAQVDAFVRVLATSDRIDSVMAPGFPETGLRRFELQTALREPIRLRLDSGQMSTQVRDTLVILKSHVDSIPDYFPSRFGLRNDSIPQRFKILIDSTDWQGRRPQPVLVDLRKDTLAETHSVLLSNTGVSQTFFGGPRYAVGLRGYPKLLLLRMLPELGFALVLFSSLLFSFYLIRRNQQRQAQLMVLKNDFIANISHELNTPITTVSVALEALEFNPDKKATYLDIARKELARLSLLVDRVLQLSQHEEGQLRLRQEEVDIKSMTEDLLQVLSLRFEKEKAQVHFSTEGERFQLITDPLHLSNVLHNLIDNALKYSDAPAQIEVQLQEQEHHFAIRILDAGIGITAEAQKRLFEKFYRAPDPRGHVVKGHGLGLSYVAQVIQALGGHIRVKSELGQGSTFTIQLPKAKT